MCTVLQSVLSNIDKVLSINRPAVVFVFGNFNVHYKDWLTYSDGTDRPGELCYNSSISNDLSHMIDFSTWIPDRGSHIPSLLDLFISVNPNICSAVVFPSLGNSYHVVVSVSIYFLSSSKANALFHRSAFDYSVPDLGVLRDHLRYVPWDGIFNLGASAAAEFY